MHSVDTFRLHLAFIMLNFDMCEVLQKLKILALQLKKHSSEKPAKPLRGYKIEPYMAVTGLMRSLGHIHMGLHVYGRFCLTKLGKS